MDDPTTASPIANRPLTAANPPSRRRPVAERRSSSPDPCDFRVPSRPPVSRRPGRATSGRGRVQSGSGRGHGRGFRHADGRTDRPNRATNDTDAPVRGRGDALPVLHLPGRRGRLSSLPSGARQNAHCLRVPRTTSRHPGVAARPPPRPITRAPRRRSDPSVGGRRWRRRTRRRTRPGPRPPRS